MIMVGVKTFKEVDLQEQDGVLKDHATTNLFTVSVKTNESEAQFIA